MNKKSIILKYFQKSDQLTVESKEYQQTISSFFQWLVVNDKVNNDKTSRYFPNVYSKANIIAKQEGILSGFEETEYLLKKFTTLSFKSNIHDGDKFKRKDIIAEIKGKSHEILSYERTILNILQRMSGIATETYIMNYELRIMNYELFIAATRKTPWMSLDKKAVAIGGGLTHRLNLSDGILLKDNHLTFVSVENAFQILLNKYNRELIEIEVTDAKQAHDTILIFNKLNTNNHLALMFDNFTPQMAKRTLDNLRKRLNLSSIIFEASGGIDKNNLLEWAKTGVDIISLGALTHSTKAINLSLEF